MKIYVNEVPKKPEECLFCKKKDGHMYCNISGQLCKLSHCAKEKTNERVLW